MQGGIIEAAEWGGWDAFHAAQVGRQRKKVQCPACAHKFTIDLKGHLRGKTAEGFTDLTLVHGQRALILFSECKDAYRDRELKPNQARWQQSIAQAVSRGARVAHTVWRPKHYDDVLSFLSGRHSDPPNESLWSPNSV